MTKEGRREEAQAAARRKRLVRAHGLQIEREWLWDWMLTITFKDRIYKKGLKTKPTKEYAESQMRQFFDWLGPRAKRRIGYLYVIGDGETTDRTHVHGLVTGVAHMNREEIWEYCATHYGRARIEEYIEGGGGAMYIARHLLDEKSELHFGGPLMPSPSKSKPATGGGVTVARSAEVSSDLFRMGLGRWRQR